MALAILFDIDGTLMDTLDTIVEAMNAAAVELHVAPAFGAGELRPMIGTPVQRQLDELRGVVGSRADEFTERYYAHFTQLVDRGVRAYPGVRETFPALAHRRIGTMSTRRRSEARHMLRVVGLESYFRAIVGGDDVGRPKPDPDLPLFAAKALGVGAGECVVVGDSPVDLLAGRAAGMRTIAARYGYGDVDRLRSARPDAAIERFDELPAILASLEGWTPP